MLLLTALIFRAVSIEFRSKQPQGWWRKLWDINFFLGSLVASLLFGILVGNLAWGMPLDKTYEYTGGFFDLLHPYALLVGLTTVALFMMHGSLFVLMKTEGDLHERARNWVRNAMIFFIICYATTTMATLLYVPRMAEPFKEHPWLFFVALANMLAIANIPREIYHKRDFNAFISSCFSILFLLALLAIGLTIRMPDGTWVPHFIVSTVEPLTHSLTVYNGASSAKTLWIMLVIALIGMPLVLGYTVSIYWVFRGKVRVESHSY